MFSCCHGVIPRFFPIISISAVLNDMPSLPLIKILRIVPSSGPTTELSMEWRWYTSKFQLMHLCGFPNMYHELSKDDTLVKYQVIYQSCSTSAWASTIHNCTQLLYQVCYMSEAQKISISAVYWVLVDVKVCAHVWSIHMKGPYLCTSTSQQQG